MRLKILSNVEEGELFFVYVNTEDGKDLRSFIKGPEIKLAETYYQCEHTSGDKWLTRRFTTKELVWA